jgi:hypothetical protein
LADIAISISNFEGSIIWLDGSVVKWRWVEGKVAGMIGMNTLKQPPRDSVQWLSEIANSISKFEGWIIQLGRLVGNLRLAEGKVAGMIEMDLLKQQPSQSVQ